MNTIPRTEEVLHDTANDFRALGAAVKEDMHHLREEARIRVEDAKQKVLQDTNQNLDRLRDYATQKPLHALAYAALGGVFLGLYLRR